MKSNRISLIACTMVGGSGLIVAAATALLLDDRIVPDLLDHRIQAYLTAHPEAVVNALNTYNANQRVIAEAAQRDAITNAQARLYDQAEDLVLGDPNAPYAIIEFLDYRCPYCKAEQAELEQLVAKDPRVKVIFKPLAMVGGPGSMRGATATYAAGRQDRTKALALHDALMNEPIQNGKLTDEIILRLAEAQGLDMTRLQADMADPAVIKLAASATDLVRDLKIQGTPFLIADYQVFPGKTDYAVLAQAVNVIVEKATILPVRSR